MKYCGSKEVWVHSSETSQKAKNNEYELNVRTNSQYVKQFQQLQQLQQLQAIENVASKK